MFRPAFRIAIAMLFAAAVVPPTQAITNGEPDGDRHPNVGFIAYEHSCCPGAILKFCGGTLIAPDVFLTAGHCTVDLDEQLASGVLTRLFVSFDPEFNFFPAPGSALFEVDSVHTHPQFNPNAINATSNVDLGIVILKERVTDRLPGVVPALLPPAGLLDALRAQNGLKGQTFTVVGYGATELVRGAGGHPFYNFQDLRNVAVSTFLSLGNDYLYVSQNPQHGDGGGCPGDSGGPAFLGDSNLIAAVVSRGDSACAAQNGHYRLDIDEARSFLGQFVALP